MAIIDYGAILKVNGKFINKNKDLFMEQTDMGYEPQNEDVGFVTTGDKNFLLSFFATNVYIYHNDKMIGWIHESPFISETIFNGDNLPNVKIEHLDKNKYLKKYTPRWKATWDYKDNHYEVIFGMGIDPNEKVWKRIKYNCYDFTDIEREIIDAWFKEKIID